MEFIHFIFIVLAILIVPACIFWTGSKWIQAALFLAVFIIGMGITASAKADSAGFGVYSDGYRVGMITKFSVKGFMVKSGEGQMLMGRESSPYVKQCVTNKGEDCSTTINPWYFSADTKDSEMIMQYAGEYAWVHYQQARVKSPNYDTEYLVNEIGAPVRGGQPATCVDQAVSGAKSDGVRVGRIVKASRKGTISKTYEILIQVGNAGNQFKNMSLDSEQMYQCTVDILKTAKAVKVYYVQNFLRLNPFGEDTTYRVARIEPVSDI